MAGAPVAALFAILHGAGNGILTITKGTLPLVLFGPHGYGVRQGLLMVPARIAQAFAPLAFGLCIDRWGAGAPRVSAVLGLTALGALLVLPRSAQEARESATPARKKSTTPSLFETDEPVMVADSGPTAVFSELAFSALNRTFPGLLLARYTDIAMLHRRPLHRCTIAFLVVLSLLFSQLALASYVCPAIPDAAAMAEMMAAGEPCEGMDAAQPVLCHQHSADMSLSFEPVKVTAPTLPAVLHVLVVPSVLAFEGQLLPPRVHPDERPPPDPVYLETRRLRV